MLCEFTFIIQIDSMIFVFFGILYAFDWQGATFKLQTIKVAHNFAQDASLGFVKFCCVLREDLRRTVRLHISCILREIVCYLDRLQFEFFTLSVKWIQKFEKNETWK